MTGADLSPEARIAAIELLMREMLAFSLARAAIVDRVRQMATALERTAVFSGDQDRRDHAAEVRAAVGRLSE